MSIDPIFIAGQQLQPTALTPEYKGAYGDFINQMKPATPRKKKTQPEVPGPYLKTKTGMEIMNPGQSADSIQVRQQKAEDEKPKPDNKNTGTGGGGAGSGANIPGGGGAGGNAVGVGTKVSAFTKLKDRLAARGLAGLYDSVVGLIQEDYRKKNLLFDFVRRQHIKLDLKQTLLELLKDCFHSAKVLILQLKIHIRILCVCVAYQRVTTQKVHWASKLDLKL